MKIMHYCQHVLGVGHYIRSMEIAAAFHSHQVLFVEGGEPLPDFTPPDHIQRMFLPPIMMDANFSSIRSAAVDIEAAKTERRQLLAKAFREFAPDVLMIELFPFGRKFFQFELVPLLKSIRVENLPVMLVCSLRDILVEKKDTASYEQGVLDILNTYFDLLLIHSDARIFSLDESFQRSPQITIPVEYTGFVTRHAPAADHRRQQHGLIVASGGGSNVGRDLLAASIRAVQRLDDATIRLHAFMGPFMDDADRGFLSGLAEQDQRTRVQPFATDFLPELTRADLSISMAGYNTCMDILSAGVKALVYPFAQNREQAFRAAKLEQLGVLEVLESIEVDHLSGRIAAKLQQQETPRPTQAILQDGAATTLHLVEKYFSRL